MTDQELADAIRERFDWSQSIDDVFDDVGYFMKEHPAWEPSYGEVVTWTQVGNPVTVLAEIPTRPGYWACLQDGTFLKLVPRREMEQRKEDA